MPSNSIRVRNVKNNKTLVHLERETKREKLGFYELQSRRVVEDEYEYDCINI